MPKKCKTGMEKKMSKPMKKRHEAMEGSEDSKIRKQWYGGKKGK